jgi:hypothetical protein
MPLFALAEGVGPVLVHGRREGRACAVDGLLGKGRGHEAGKAKHRTADHFSSSFAHSCCFLGLCSCRNERRVFKASTVVLTITIRSILVSMMMTG